jgi:hypothetical protein
MNKISPPYGLIFEELQKGDVIPFLGSGASLGNRNPGTQPWKWEESESLPTSGELSSFLAKQTEFPEDESMELSKVTEYYEVIAAGRKPLYNQLHSVFNKDFPITSLHKFLSEISVPLLIITTNYDDLIERAFISRKPFDLVIHATGKEFGDKILWRKHGNKDFEKVIPNKLNIELDKWTVIYKMHGTVNRNESSLDQDVITEDDYIDFLTRMTKTKAIPAIFAEKFQNLPFLFLGYSLMDWNLRVVLNSINDGTGYSKKIKSWAIQKNPSQLEQRFWQARGVEVYDLTIEEFVANLQKRK